MKKRSRAFPFLGCFLILAGILLLESFVVPSLNDSTPAVIEVKNPQATSTPLVQAPARPAYIAPLLPTEGLVGFWNFNECWGMNPADASGFKNKGYTNGDVVWSPDTKEGIGCALAFDASHEYVTTGPHESINITDDITISAWIKTDTFKGDQGIVDKTDNAAWDYSFYLHGDKLAFASTFGSPATTTSTSTISGTGWHNVVVTRKGHVITFYIDGVHAGYSLMAGQFAPSFVSLVFGNHRFKDQFIGAMDDIRIYNRSLSAGEIAELATDKTEEKVQESPE